MPLWMLTDMVGVFIGALECFACLRLDSLLLAQGICCDRIHASALGGWRSDCRDDLRCQLGAYRRRERKTAVRRV